MKITGICEHFNVSPCIRSKCENGSFWWPNEKKISIWAVCVAAHSIRNETEHNSLLCYISSSLPILLRRYTLIRNALDWRFFQFQPLHLFVSWLTIRDALIDKWENREISNLIQFSIFFCGGIDRMSCSTKILNYRANGTINTFSASYLPYKHTFDHTMSGCLRLSSSVHDHFLLN